VNQPQLNVEWPYPIKYENQAEISVDVLVLGGGIAGCWAAITAASKGASVAIVEKAATVRSGAGGAGCDHWGGAVNDNPLCPLTVEEFLDALVTGSGGYNNGIATYVNLMESYQTLLELEQMGAKVRDTGDEFAGAEFRDEKSKLLFAYDYTNRNVVRVWGTTFKPVLYKECKRLGVKICDRVSVTSLLTEGGRQGARVVGATGLNIRTGEFIVFKSKATISCMAQPDRVWHFKTETSGLADMSSPGGGGGWAMAWKAGAEFTKMEGSMQQSIAVYYPCQGAGHPRNTWFACNFLDANGKQIPWIDRDGKLVDTVSARYHPVDGQKFIHFGSTVYEYKMPSHISIDEMVQKGELMLPLYADLTGMPAHERRAIFGLMVGQESKSNSTYKNYTEAGFDPDKDMLQGYQMLTGGGYGVGTVGAGLWGTSAAYGLTIGGRSIRRATSGGLVVDWDMLTSLEGLYAAGGVVFGATGHSAAATSGKYAARSASEYIKKASAPEIDNNQVEREKARVYAPIHRSDGIDWKELNNGLNKVMQAYCGDPKNDHLLNMGLMMLNDLKDAAASDTYAADPHKLGRIIEVMDIITSAEIILHACLARKASSRSLGFIRYDYPDVDPPEWRKFITVKQVDGKVEIGGMPLDFWGDAKKNYSEHCSL